MAFKRPLTLEQLREIQACRRGDPDVKALLWEIRRLHAIALRAYQIESMSDPTYPGVLGELRRTLADTLDREPVVIAHEITTQNLMKKAP